jgi:hypothetical protein
MSEPDPDARIIKMLGARADGRGQNLPKAEAPDELNPRVRIAQPAPHLGEVAREPRAPHAERAASRGLEREHPSLVVLDGPHGFLRRPAAWICLPVRWIG